MFGTPPENDRELAALTRECMFNPEADVPTAPTIVVNFMRVERRFHAGRIESNKATIAHWFTVLPDAFTAEGGSYLEATATNYGSRWTHRLKTVKLWFYWVLPPIWWNFCPMNQGSLSCCPPTKANSV